MGKNGTVKGREFKITNRNVSDGHSRKLNIKFYSLVTLFIVTLALIGLLEFVNRSFPGISTNSFSPTNTGTHSASHTSLVTSSSQKIIESTTTAPLHRRQSAPSYQNGTSASSTPSPTTESTSSTLPPTNTTEFFVPVTYSVTATPTPSGSCSSCSCPSNSEVPGCLCNVDSTATTCQCTFRMDNSTGVEYWYQDCICPPDPCTTCMCPAGVGSYLVPCCCPPDPVAAGCSCGQSSGSNPDGCSLQTSCTCGSGVMRTYGSDLSTFNTTTLSSISQSPSINSTSSVQIQSNSSSISTPDVPSVSSSSAIVLVSSSTPDIPSVSSSSGIVLAPSTPDISSVSGSSELVLIPASSSTTTMVPMILLTTMTNSNGSSSVIPTTIMAALPAQHIAQTPSQILSSSFSPLPVSTSTFTNSQGEEVVTTISQIQPLITPPPGVNPLKPILSYIVTTNSLGSLTTNTITLTPGTSISTGVIYFVSSSTTTSADGSVYNTPVTYLQVQADPSLPSVTDSSGSIITVSPQLIATSAAPNPIPTGVHSSGGGPTSSNGNDGASNVLIMSWPQAKTFLGGYLPILLAKGYQIAWASLYRQARNAAPINLLTSANGATGNALNGAMDTLSWINLVPYIASTAIVPFVSAGISFDTDYGCSNPNLANPTNPCWPPKLTANVWVIRLVQSFLSLIALVAITLVALWFKKPRESTNDPTSIAAVAAIAGHPEVVRDFTCDDNTNESTLKDKLKQKRYTLTEFADGSGERRYGLVPITLEPVNDTIGKSESKSSKLLQVFGTRWSRRAIIFDGIFIVYVLGLLAIVAVYISNIDKTELLKMFSGSSIGKRILFAILASIVSINLGRIERDVQTLTPYMELRNCDASGKSTILLRRHTLPWTSIIPMFRNRHFVAGIVAFAAILAEFLIISLSGLPYRPGQLRSEFIFCALSSLVILILLLIITVVTIFWRSQLPNLPRKPDRVASVLTYVCNSTMLNDFRGLERCKEKERDQAIQSLHKTYGYVQISKWDGGKGWAIDETR